jgi:hypothetical protein
MRIKFIIKQSKIFVIHKISIKINFYFILNNKKTYILINSFIYLFKKIHLWGLGIGDWAQSPIPNPQSPLFYTFFK